MDADRDGRDRCPDGRRDRARNPRTGLRG
jgi:hypothetical protein